MDSLEFECPLCTGLFSAAVTDVEVTCPHCDKKVSLSVVDSSPVANVTMVAKRIATPEPLFPPGHKTVKAIESPVTPETTPEPPPIVIMDGEAVASIGDTESLALPATFNDELPIVVTVDDGKESAGDPELMTPPEPVAGEIATVVMTNGDNGESSTSTESSSAIDELLPPSFQLGDLQVDQQTATEHSTEVLEVIDVRVDTEPATVGRGINQRELRSRTKGEKSKFMRTKNLIVWGIGALIIIVTMVVMLQLT